MLTKAIIATLGLAVIAVPASASASPATSKPAGKAVSEKKYCISTVNTGTRIGRKECKTKADWAKEGVQIEKRG